jgi:uncharacterized protein (TIGR03437 family)
MVWSNAPEFGSGLMPTQLGGVSVTVNGKPAYVHYVSATQVNALPPIDAVLGPVEIVVTHGGQSTASYIVNKVPVAPSFPLVGGNYIVSQHTDYTLVGPPALSSSGYLFTPAKRGETIILYAFGFGLPTTTLVNGSSTQTGPLPVLPTIYIGGSPAMVQFAGVIAPGLYQINVTIPSTAQPGDNQLSCHYNGATAPIGWITIEP